MYRVMRRNMLQEDEGHHQKYDLFYETREDAQRWIDTVGADGYFDASAFYVVNDREPERDAFNAGWDGGYKAAKGS